jgi:hypothetical protein
MPAALRRRAVPAEQGWRRIGPWATSFVDADATGPGLLLGLSPADHRQGAKSDLYTERFPVLASPPFGRVRDFQRGATVIPERSGAVNPLRPGCL